MTFHCMDVPHLVYAFSWWIFVLLAHFSYSEHCCIKCLDCEFLRLPGSVTTCGFPIFHRWEWNKIYSLLAWHRIEVNLSVMIQKAPPFLVQWSKLEHCTLDACLSFDWQTAWFTFFSYNVLVPWGWRWCQLLKTIFLLHSDVSFSLLLPLFVPPYSLCTKSRASYFDRDHFMSLNFDEEVELHVMVLFPHFRKAHC